MPSDPTRVAGELLAESLSRPPSMGEARLVCVDGLAGSGKTTLAAELGRLAGTDVLHLDDFYPGWRGLDRVVDQVLPLLLDLAANRTAHYRRWDWERDEFAEDVSVEPAELVVLEGVGAGHRSWAELTTLLVWVEAPRDLRLQRGLARDGQAVRDQWVRWQEDELAYLARELPDQRADRVVRTST